MNFLSGGTSVTNALECPISEKRMILSLDMHEMNKIKWIDYQSMMACIEAGIIGKIKRFKKKKQKNKKNLSDI